MQCISFRLFILGLCWLASVPASFAEQLPKILKVGIGLRPVFQYAVADNQYTGLDVELGTVIAKEAGYQLELLEYPWPRIVFLMKSGKLDLTFSAAKNEERKQWAWFTTEHFRHGRNYLYGLKSGLGQFEGVNSLKDLEEYSLVIGVQRGYQYSPEYEKLLDTTWFSRRLQVFNEPETIVEALLKGRVDAFIGSEYGTADVLMRQGASDDVQAIFNLMPYFTDARTFMMFSKASVSQQVVSDFNAAIKKVRASGQLQAIEDKYANP